MKLVEVRTYRLKPGTAERFVDAVQIALPLVRDSGMDVLAFGRSDHEQESFFLIRAFADRNQLVCQQDAFYGSSAWREGLRLALISCVDTYLNTLLWLPPLAVEAI